LESTGLRWRYREQRLQCRIARWRAQVNVAAAALRLYACLTRRHIPPTAQEEQQQQGIYKACLYGRFTWKFYRGTMHITPGGVCLHGSVWHNPVWDEYMDVSRSIGPRNEYHRSYRNISLVSDPVYLSAWDRWIHRRNWLRPRLAEWRAACGITGKRCVAYRALRHYRTTRIRWALYCWYSTSTNYRRKWYALCLNFIPPHMHNIKALFMKFIAGLTDLEQ